MWHCIEVGLARCIRQLAWVVVGVACIRAFGACIGALVGVAWACIEAWAFEACTWVGVVGVSCTWVEVVLAWACTWVVGVLVCTEVWVGVACKMALVGVVSSWVEVGACMLVSWVGVAFSWVGACMLVSFVGVPGE